MSKVLFCDPLNTQNNFFLYTKCLRQVGVDCTLVIDSGGMLPKSHSPGWHDTSKTNYAWIKQLAFPLTLNPFKFVWRSLLLMVAISRYDFIVCSGYAPMWV